MADELSKDCVDEMANLQFQKLFFERFPQTKLTFFSGSFQQCLREVTDTKKPLLFFLHNENIHTSETYCKLLTEPKIESLVSKKFLCLGWKINTDSKDFCQNLADKILIIEGEVSQLIKEQIPTILIVLPDTGTDVKVFRKITIGIDSVDNFQASDNFSSRLLSALTEADEILSYFDYFKGITAIKYQQWMNDRLGNRDYDSFEPDEERLLKDKILYAMYGPPKDLEDGYKPEEIEKSENIYNTIREKNNQFAKWNNRIVVAFIYNCIEPLQSVKLGKAKKDLNYNPESDFGCVPIFVVRKCKLKRKDENKKDDHNNPQTEHSCKIYIDSDCRVYDSWQNYLENNKLPPCKMIYPKLGRYCRIQDSENNGLRSRVPLGEMFSPSCSKSTQILQAADMGSGILGFASGIALAAVAFTPIAPAAITIALASGITTGVYGSVRSGATLVDRKKHQQSVGIIKSSESRAAYLNIFAGAASVLGAGATKLLSTAVQKGFNIGKGVQHTITAVNGASVVISGTATVNSCFDVYQQCTKDKVTPSALTIAQLGSSLFFFGNSVYNFRTGAAMVQEMQANKITQISEELSNRQRKTFTKLLKESMRVEGMVKGRAEVISSMRNIESRRSILSALTRSNKNFNKMGVRFSAEGGGVKLNGVSVDIVEFGNLPKTQQGVRLENLPPIPENHSPANFNNTRNMIQNIRYDNNIFGGVRLDPTTAITCLMGFAQELQPKILKICEDFANQMDVDVIASLKRIFKEDIRSKIIQYVTDFIRIYIGKLQHIFRERLLHEDVTRVCDDFGFKNPHVNISDFVDYVVKGFLDGDMMKTLWDNFKVWYTSLEVQEDEKNKRKGVRRDQHNKKQKQNCLVCNGYYYQMNE